MLNIGIFAVFFLSIIQYPEANYVAKTHRL